MLGGNIPDDVRVECAKRTRWYHSAGHGGSLGALGLIDMLRFLGYDRPVPEDVPPKVDWRQLPMDGTCKVEAKLGGTWLVGAYVGQTPEGRLAIRLEGDDWVRECRSDFVRLASDDLLSVVVVDQPPEPVSELAGPAESVALDDTAELPVQPEPAPEPEPQKVTCDWPEGQAVLVDFDGDVVDGRFIKLDGENALIQVVGEDKPREFPFETVTSLG